MWKLDRIIYLQQVGPANGSLVTANIETVLQPNCGPIFWSIVEYPRNTPGGQNRKSRIEYKFQTYDAINAVFIELKLKIGGSTERLNFVAQVIAECDGMVRDALNLDIN